eukprot:CAMPEP_0194510226 /NCGR_PEP_ID=MMETSP0253-20130528/41469_1 /TAXON_ID=2966 /ORGANISM="Noctiluca scintillans" /LENGTH=161 /DNA_ID=CAMNT_0039353447 /DNA_START=114 /DNA_END=599 /DNA_ORIENTATION=-
MAEERLWKMAFLRLDPENTGMIATGYSLLRSYLSDATTLGSDLDVLERVLVVRSRNGFLDYGTFVHILKEFTFDDTDAIMLFQSLASGEEQIESTHVRSGLLGIGQTRLGATGFSADLWDSVLNVVMQDADFMVDMENWVGLCKTFARYVRALKQQRQPVL